jgi:hypothetical protein
MQTVNLKFQIREKVNKNTSQAIDRLFDGETSQNPTLETVLRNAVYNMERVINISSRQLLGRLSKL